MAAYKPKRGDVVMMNFTPQSGKEMKDEHPALVLSNSNYNAKGALCVVCPITTKSHDYPFEITLETQKKKVVGFVISDQVKSIDYKVRKARKVDSVKLQFVDQVSSYVKALLEIK